MNNQDLAIEIYKRLLEVDINASMASIPVIEEVLNEERERRLTKCGANPLKAGEVLPAVSSYPNLFDLPA